MTKRLVFLVALAGCFAPLHPSLELDPGASLKGYRIFVIEPVVDHTGQPFDLDVADSLRAELADRLRSHGLTVMEAQPTDTASHVLLIASALTGFRGMANQMEMAAPAFSGGDMECQMVSDFSDARTGRHIGVMTASDMGGRRQMVLLDECAHDMADAIYQQVTKH